MGAPRVRSVVGVLSIVGAALLLAGCGTPVVTPKPTETAPQTSASPTAPAEQPSTEDVLFIITANVRAVGGRTVGISMTAHEPIPSTDKSATTLRDDFLSVCAAGNGSQPIDEAYLANQGSTLMKVDLSTNTPDQNFAEPLLLFFGSPYFAQAVVGSGVIPMPGGQTCFSGFEWTTSGSIHGIADFENAEGVPDLGQWRYGNYGFTVSSDSGATIEACKVTITDIGMKAGIDQVPGWDPSAAGTGVACGIGYSGE